jgi:hypothetical protein
MNFRDVGVNGVVLIVGESTKDASSIILLILSHVHALDLVGTCIVIVPMTKNSLPMGATSRASHRGFHLLDSLFSFNTAFTWSLARKASPLFNLSSAL